MNTDLEVVFEDNQILVAVKPHNIPSQADDSGDPDMLSMVKEYIRIKYEKPGEAYIGLVHRLDRPAGGLMVFARTSKSASRLSEQMRTGGFSKKYLAAVWGSPVPAEATLTGFLSKDGDTNIVHSVGEQDPGAKKACLSYRTIASAQEISLVSIDLDTGRSHQIRVQMADAGYPLYGDVKYGHGPSPTKKLALWSYELAFQHPVTKEKMEFKKAPPKEKPWDIAEFSAAIAKII